MDNEKCDFLGCERNVFDDRRKCICHLENKKGSEIQQFDAIVDRLLHDAVSERDADFRGFVFPYIKEISYSDIKKNLNFKDAIFEGDANFAGIILNFSNAIFKGDVNFSKNTFNNDINFDNTIFKCDVDFSSVKFKNVIFKDTKFPIDNGRIVKFNGVIHENIKFQNVNLKNVSLSYTDLANIEFFDVKWNRNKFRLRDKVVDEDLVGKDKNITYDAVTQLYRGLRSSFEKKYRFAEAGDFFAGETDIRRKNEKFGNKIILTIYKLLGYYGESYWIPTFWTIMTILFYPIAYDWLFNTDPLISYRHDSFSTIRNSTASFFQMNTYYIGQKLYIIYKRCHFYIFIIMINIINIREIILSYK